MTNNRRQNASVSCDCSVECRATRDQSFSLPTTHTCLAAGLAKAEGYVAVLIIFLPDHPALRA
jgi:hypothetical protein